MINEIKEAEPFRIFISYDESETGGEAEDDGPWAHHADVFREVEFKSLFKNSPKERFFYDSVEVSNPKMLELQCLYLCVVRYGTGSTFGHVSGAWHIVGLAPSYKVAEAMLKEALEAPKGYKPWEGYFESFEGTEIHKLDLIDN